MKTIGAIALLAGIAVSVPAFAQTADPGANAVVGGAPGAAVGAAIGGGVGATSGVVNTPPPAYGPPPPPPPPGYYH
jgi:hypothetical protein